MKAGMGLAWLILVIVLAMACRVQNDTAAGANSETEVEAIKAVIADYVSGYESRDVENFVKVFTRDAVRMPPNSPSVVGSEGIRAYYEKWFEHQSLDVAIVPTEIHVAGGWAYAYGTYEATVILGDNEGSSKDYGKWLNIYKKGVDGAWKFHRNIWNSDLPVSTEQDSEN
jgi:uncharacterized protein (TIGR02246 family)